MQKPPHEVQVTSTTTRTNQGSTNQTQTSWAITSCSLHGTVSIDYCDTKCGMKEHCEIWLNYKKKNGKEKVEFT
jgi:hypothetical protein